MSRAKIDLPRSAATDQNAVQHRGQFPKTESLGTAANQEEGVEAEWKMPVAHEGIDLGITVRSNRATESTNVKKAR